MVTNQRKFQLMGISAEENNSWSPQDESNMQTLYQRKRGHRENYSEVSDESKYRVAQHFVNTVRIGAVSDYTKWPEFAALVTSAKRFIYKYLTSNEQEN